MYAWAVAAYYVDSQISHDANSGGSPEQAWKSLERVNAHAFRPTDKVLFRAESRVTGQLRP